MESVEISTHAVPTGLHKCQGSGISLPFRMEKCMEQSWWKRKGLSLFRQIATLRQLSDWIF